MLIFSFFSQLGAHFIYDKGEGGGGCITAFPLVTIAMTKIPNFAQQRATRKRKIGQMKAARMKAARMNATGWMA